MEKSGKKWKKHGKKFFHDRNGWKWNSICLALRCSSPPLAHLVRVAGDVDGGLRKVALSGGGGSGGKSEA